MVDITLSMPPQAPLSVSLHKSAPTGRRLHRAIALLRPPFQDPPPSCRLWLVIINFASTINTEHIITRRHHQTLSSGNPFTNTYTSSIDGRVRCLILSPLFCIHRLRGRSPSSLQLLMATIKSFSSSLSQTREQSNNQTQEQRWSGCQRSEWDGFA